MTAEKEWTWAHAILEIYPDDDGLPETGTPADWIEQKLVGYTDSTVEGLVYFIPTLVLLKGRARRWRDDVWHVLTMPYWWLRSKLRPNEFDLSRFGDDEDGD